MKEITIPASDILAESRNMLDHHRRAIISTAAAIHLNPHHCKILVVEDKGFYITVKGSRLVKDAQKTSKGVVDCVLLDRSDIQFFAP
jgi:hypothetical protein